MIALALDPNVLALAITAVIGAIGGVIVLVLKQIGDNQKAAREDAAVAAAQARADAASAAVEMARISHSVDGAASRSVERIDALQQRVEQLVRELADAKDTATTLAATTAATIPGIDAARAEGKAAGIEQERVRGEDRK